MINQELSERYLRAKRALFDRVFGERLNPEQRRAVFTAKGPLLVLAGAGSGKTTVLVNRICYLIRYGNAYHASEVAEGGSLGMVEALEEAVGYDREEVEQILDQFISEPCPPWQVLAFTFTNKAAREIKERLEKSFSDPEIASAIWAGTFHSICLRILRKYADRLGYRDGFSIYDTDDKKRLVSDTMKELAIDEKTLGGKVVCEQISRAKDELIRPEDFEITRDPRTKNIKRIYERYNQKLREYNAMDFDDIIMNCVTLLEENEDVRAYYQAKFRYVLVDEYQDTNHAQFILTKLLSDGQRNIMVVGDDDQSIYRFRGATVENILQFDKTYPDATVIKLEQNYRSTENILNAANAVIGNNTARHPKALWSERGEGEKITVHEAQTQIEEGRYILSKITDAVRRGERKYSDFAVLYRLNELSRSLEQSFAKSGIPYRILGAQRFTDRKEIRDIVAYLFTVSDGHDDQRLKRIINEPKRKIGQSTVEAIEGIARMNGLSMFEVLRRADEYLALSKSKEKLSEFVSLIEELRRCQQKPSELIDLVFEKTGYHDMLKAEGFEGETRIANVKEFVSSAVEYEQRCEDASIEPTLEGFLEEITLVSDVDKYDETADAVVLMTVHSAKGLEFPVVFIAGMEDAIFPSLTDMTNPDDLAEERRLCYVAITRAKERVYITHARNRMMYGRTSFNPLSKFIREEIPSSLILREGGKKEPPRMSSSSYAQGFYTRGESRREPYGTSAYGGRSEEDRMSGASPFSSRTSYGGYRTGASSSNSQTVGASAKKGAAGYGVEQLAPGTRVRHAIFGDGVILSSRPMGGDVLYSVKFDSGEEKRLMATFAKLEKI